MNSLTRQLRCFLMFYVWFSTLLWILSVPIPNLTTAHAADTKPWPHKPVTKVTSPVDCVITKRVGDKMKDVGYVNLTFTEKGVRGTFSAEYEKESGKISIRGSFSNAKYGHLISNMNEIDYLPENEGKTWHVDDYKGTLTHEFHGNGQYTSTFRFFPDKDGKTRESQHDKGRIMIGGSREQGVWNGMIRVHEKNFRWNLRWEAIARIVQPEPGELPEEKQKKKLCNLENELQTLREKAGDVSALILFSKNNLSEVATDQPKIERIRAELKDLQNRVFIIGDPSEPMGGMGYYDPGVTQQSAKLRKRLMAMFKKQDEVIAAIDNSYTSEVNNIETLIGQLHCPEVKKAMGVMKQGLVDQQDLMYIQMYFATGQREKFKAIAEEYLARKRFVHQTYWMLAQDYLHHREMSDGLYALRKARKSYQEELAKHKGKKIPLDFVRAGLQIEDMIQRTEIGFLIAVDKKVMGEAAIVRSVLWGELDQGELTFWNALTNGVPTWLGGFGRWKTGESGIEARADSYGVIALDAATQHAGLMAILRLRVRGLTLEQIKGLDNEGLIREVYKRFKKHKLSPKRAKRLRALIYQGFRNPDMVRLMKRSKEEFDLYKGRPYYSPAEFQQAWYEVGGDFILNPLMMFAMFAPSAKLTTDTGKFLWFPKYMTAAEAGTCKTFVQWGAGVIRAPELIRRATSTNTMLARRIQGCMRFYAQSSLMTRILTEGMIQTGAIQLAALVGGLPAQVVAEVLVMLGGGDLDRAVDVLKNAGIRGSAARRLAAGLKEILDESLDLRNQARIVSRQNTIKSILATLDAGGAIDDGLRATLKQGAEELDQILKQLGNAGNSDLMRMQALQIDLAARAQRALAKGDVVRTRFLVAAIDDADGFVTAVAKKLEDGVTVAERAARSAGDSVSDLAETVKVRFPADASISELGERMTSTDRGCHRAVKLWEQLRADPAFKAAEEAMRKGDLDAAVEVYHAKLTAINTRLEAAVSSGNPNAVKNNMEELLLYLESYTIARDVRDASRRLKPFGKVAEDRFMDVIDSPKAKAVGAKVTEAFEQVREGAKQLDEALPPLTTSAGEATKDVPRLVKIGKETFMFREIKKTGGELVDETLARKSEIFASRFAKKLEINSPACSEISWVGADGKTRRGIMQRVVANVSDLSAVDRGTALAVKKHVAEDKVLSLILGDPDRHARNFLITVDGKVYSIDHGEAAIIETVVQDWGKAPGEIKKTVNRMMETRYKIYLSKMNQWHIMSAIEKRIDLSDMKDILERVGNLKRSDIEALLDGLYTSKSADFKKAVDTIMMRIEYVEELLKNPPTLGSLEIHRLAWKQSAPSEVTGEAGKKAIEEQNVGRVEMFFIKRKTMPERVTQKMARCWLRKGSYRWGTGCMILDYQP